ncbi:MAG: flagellar type III secretion system pore protein FliP [Planctomycetota bacterium]|jgi:flagellar biosynthetic protein FliP
MIRFFTSGGIRLELERVNRKRRWPVRKIVLFAMFALGCLMLAGDAHAASVPTVDRSFLKKAESPDEVATTIEVLIALTVLSLAPAILILTTAFTRIVIVLSFLRRALATQELPPNQVIIGLALFLTFFVMAPTWKEVNEKALGPYMDGLISQKEAFELGIKPVRKFMLGQLLALDGEKELKLFVDLNHHQTGEPYPKHVDEIPTMVLIPAFVIGELKKAFMMGFLLYLPFLVIDLVVASTLISMGMLVLPPILISLPFKILLFVLVDGWTLVVGQVVESFML